MTAPLFTTRAKRPNLLAARVAWLLVATQAIALALGQTALAQGPPQSSTMVSLPVPQFTASGELVVRPNVAPTAGSWPGSGGPTIDGFSTPVTPYSVVSVPGASAEGALDPLAFPPAEGGVLPEALPSPEGAQAPAAPGGFLNGFWSNEPDIWLAGEPPLAWDEVSSMWRERQTSPTGESGLGRERVALAPFEIDISQPQGNFRWRTDAVYDLTKPDRSEYFWSAPGRGPALERSVSYQDLRFLLETGSPSFSLGTEVPIRLLNPEINDNTAGVGDIQLIQKAVMLNGNRWQMTQLTRTTFNNGNARKGLGTGHVSIEPGMLFRFQYSELTYVHSELKMTFPIAGDPEYSGQALKWGIGISTIYYETDTLALMPTLEFTNIWLLDGLFTPFPAGAPVDVRGDGIFNLAPGLRMACDTGGDLGVVELGVSSILAVGSDGWYDALLRLDLRFAF